ncbi:MAG: endonuclease domain-containing protein [Candidatus Nomurabacteria bacterium]|nr:endonuclease domain-containing protein [Candidatus Nomurabacteria bacterium]
MSKLQEMTKARYLRKEETKAEKILWEEIRNNKLGIKFRRQHPIDRFIIDFYVPKIKLAIELDGEIHKENKEYDKMRTEYLNSKNIKVLRFWNSEIETDLKKVLDKIKITTTNIQSVVVINN